MGPKSDQCSWPQGLFQRSLCITHLEQHQLKHAQIVSVIMMSSRNGPAPPLSDNVPYSSGKKAMISLRVHREQQALDMIPSLTQGEGIKPGINTGGAVELSSSYKFMPAFACDLRRFCRDGGSSSKQNYWFQYLPWASERNCQVHNGKAAGRSWETKSKGRREWASANGALKKQSPCSWECLPLRTFSDSSWSCLIGPYGPSSRELTVRFIMILTTDVRA